ncbi:MAG: CHASE3 domain-containing protein [Actinomycetota bacterium]|nr:CHASE3 domain-containing protein [Actinomycetota bacterium]
MKGGLGRRTLFASSLLAVTLGIAFAFMLVSIAQLRESVQLARQAEQVLKLANNLERLFIDLETGQRGFVITGDERFLEPWNAARTAFPREAQVLERLVADNAEQLRRAENISAAGESYVRDYSVPLIDAARAGDPSARSLAATSEGKRRVDAMREEFDRFIATEEDLARGRQEQADTAARRSAFAAMGGVSASLLFIALFGAYLTRAVVRPVRRAAAMAARLAGGDLSARMRETEHGEIGELERSFNVMAQSLEQGREELGRLAEEQAALRRVATLVARGISPDEIFAAVVNEVGALLSVDFAHMGRYDSEGTVTWIAAWSKAGEALALGTPLSLDGESVSASIVKRGQPVRIDDYSQASGPLAESMKQIGIRSSVGGPIVVDGRVWGVMVASSRAPRSLPPQTESRLTAFTELVATAISNAQARADLAASRARVVAAADESRRRIERDLHDGTQQRLVSLALELRGAEAMVPDDLSELRSDLVRIREGVEAALDDLREIARGIHPPILSEGGLGLALKALARRSPLPVELEVRIDSRLPEVVEVGAYYVASEAMTNAAKHAKASVAHVTADARDGILHLVVSDDGIGGADRAKGSGLLGLKDRVEALGGKIDVLSPPGGGTRISVELPIPGN